MQNDLTKLPNVLVVTDTSISMAHGTGTALLRHFAAYPQEHLLNIYYTQKADAAFRQNCYIKPRLLPRLLMRLMREARINQAVGVYEKLEKMIFRNKVRQNIERFNFVPDLIYATCHSEHGFRMLAELVSAYGGDVPIIQHFLDYLRYDTHRASALLKKLSPALTEIWSLTETMLEEVTRQLDRPVQLVRAFHCNLPATYKKTHRAFSPEFQAVMVGNCWYPNLLQDIRCAWRWLGEQSGGLPPIRWYCHPTTIADLKARRIQIEPEIMYAGFVPMAQLLQKLQPPDMAIIPFNREVIPENDYARFSLPSRMTEMASVGLPIFCAAGPETETKRYIESKGIGVCSLLSDGQQFRQDLLSFVQDSERRSLCGMNARQLAINEFDLASYQRWFYQKLITTAHSRR